MVKGNTGLVDISQSRIAIVGLGLMGGAMAMALQSKTAEVAAVDVNLVTIELAIEMGIINSGTTDLATGIKKADLIILATPVSTITDLLIKLPIIRPDGCAVIDLGSTKREICLAMEHLPQQFSAVGGHPMCGREQSGLSAATADLYRDQLFVLCRNKRTTPEIELLAIDLIRSIGARSYFLEPNKHDAIVAATSHLPYIISSTLMNCVSALAKIDDSYWKVSATGLRDTTRLAGSDPKMMLDILYSNRERVLSQLHNYMKELTMLIELMEKNEQEALLSWLKDVNLEQQSYRNKRWHDSDIDDEY